MELVVFCEGLVMAIARTGAGQTALITGASSGIGLELARRFAEDGYNLVLVARTAETLTKAAADIEAVFQTTATAVPLDLGQPGTGQELADLLSARGISVDVLVNNAGFGATGPFSSSDPSSQTGMIDLNARALVELTRIFLPAMAGRKRGGILNVASIAAFQPGPSMAVYCATKAFVLSFTEALSEELRGSGVHVTCLCPGTTESAFHKRAGTGELRLFQTGMRSAKSVAKFGYAAFQRNQRVAIPGVANAITAHLAGILPRGLVLRAAKLALSPR
jgi:short-subunit dehydrogenase